LRAIARRLASAVFARGTPGRRHRRLRFSKHVTHTLADIIGFRLHMIAPGYEDGDDAGSMTPGSGPELVFNAASLAGPQSKIQDHGGCPFDQRVA
jgi:hypothetical protein